MYISSKSVPLSLSCAWGKRTLTHVWSDIPIEHDDILFTCLTVTRAVSGVGVNGEKMSTIPDGVQGREKVFGQRGATRSHHELWRQSAGLRASRTRIQREAAVVDFLSRRDTMICDNTVLFPL